MSDELKNLAHTLKDIRIAMLTTTAEGKLFSRPMVNLEIEEDNFDGKLWFFTDKHSFKVDSILSDNHVNLSYVHTEKGKYVSVSGQARIIQDKDLFERHWSPRMKSWFPDGVDSAGMALLCVEIDSAEVWDAPTSRMVKLLEMARSFTGKEHHHPGDQRHYEIRGQ